jgi:acyl-CoA synthetase (NDP forming)
MRDLLFPTNIAVVGAAASPGNLGKNIVENLLNFDFQGRIYPVTPSGGEVHGLTIYQSVLDIPDPVDFAAILIPASNIPNVLEECGRKGIRRILISSGGFGEFHHDKKDLERELLLIADRYDIRFLGPNCIGIINLENGLCLPFNPVRRESLIKGPHSMLSQSGGVTLELAHLFSDEKLGFSKLLSMGNKLNINEADLVKYLIEDPETEQIFLYLEGLDNLKTLMKLARSTHKPIVVCKANRHQETREIAHCHTAALASDDRIADAGFRQAGMLRVATLKDMTLCAKALKLPPLRGDNLAVLSMSGGIAVLTADACIDNGFRLPPLPRDLLDHIEKHRRGGVIRMTNPLDFGDIYDLDMFMYTVDKVLGLDNIDGMVLSMPFSPDMARMLEKVPEMGQVFQNVLAFSEKYDKPIAFSFFTEKEYLDHLKELLNFPIFDDAVQSVRGMRFLRDFTRSKNKTADPIPSYPVKTVLMSDILQKARNENRNELFCHEVLCILEHYGIQTVKTEFAASLDEAGKVAGRLGYPLAMKIVSPQISHKSDVGGVILNLKNEAELVEAYEKMYSSLQETLPDAELRGVTLQVMASEGYEMILGAKWDPSAGHVLMLGLGGIFVEVMEDISFRVVPVSSEDAQEMIAELKGHRILKGFRGSKPADLEALTDTILRLSQLLKDIPEIKELDINPVMILEEGKGLQALDARILF